MDSPGYRARVVLARGISLDPLVRAAVEAHQDELRWNGYLDRIVRMPKWSQVELWLTVYERMRWHVPIPDGSRLERALWAVGHEQMNFGRNVFGGEWNGRREPRLHD